MLDDDSLLSEEAEDVDVLEVLSEENDDEENDDELDIEISTVELLDVLLLDSSCSTIWLTCTPPGITGPLRCAGTNKMLDSETVPSSVETS